MREGIQLNEEHEAIAYADTIAAINENMHDIGALYTQLTNAAKKIGLQVNMDKTVLAGKSRISCNNKQPKC